MFRLSQKSNYDGINFNLKSFFKCTDCLLVPKCLRRVCENGHFFCEDCSNYILLTSKRCWVCEAPFAINRLTFFNSMLDIVRSTSIESGAFIEKLKQVLECPVCYEETLTSLTVCNSGHNICRRCSLLTGECPLCKDYFIPRCCVIEIQRNLEDVLLSIPCSNLGNGCQALNDYNDLKNHVDKCSFVPWNCGVGDCTWSGIVETTQRHAKEFHPTCILKGRRVYMTLQLDNNLHLQTWSRKKNQDYNIFYKMTAQGLKLVVYSQRSSGEKFMFYLAYGQTPSCQVPFVESSESPTYFITNQCPTLVPANLVDINKPFIVCLLKAEEGRWRSVVIFIIKIALMMIKFFTF